MAKASVLVSGSTLFLVAAAYSSAALAGGDVIDKRVDRPHHHHRVIVERQIYVSHDFSLQAPLPAVGNALHRGAFHGSYVGGNYAYNPAYLELRTADNGAARPVDGIAYGSDSNNSIPYTAGSVSGYGGGGSYGADAAGGAGPGVGAVIYEQNTTATPAPVVGFRNEYRTRTAYGFNYDYETENPACWKGQYVGGQIRHVWTCPGGQ